MWHVKVAEAGRSWASVGEFETLVSATREIVEREGYPVSRVFFELSVDTKDGTDGEQAAEYLEHKAKGSKNCYVVQRLRH